MYKKTRDALWIEPLMENPFLERRIQSKPNLLSSIGRSDAKQDPDKRSHPQPKKDRIGSYQKVQR